MKRDANEKAPTEKRSLPKRASSKTYHRPVVRKGPRLGSIAANQGSLIATP